MYRLKAVSSALAVSARSISAARIPQLLATSQLPPVLPRCCPPGPATAVLSPMKSRLTLQMMLVLHFAIARTARSARCTCLHAFFCVWNVSELIPYPQKFTGCNFGITSKIPKSAFKIKSGSEHVKVHEADNGSGVVLHREFCDTCGSGLLEYGVRYSYSSSKVLLNLPVHLHWRLLPAGGPEMTNMAPMGTGQRRRIHLHLLRDARQSRRSATKGRILLQEEGQLDAGDSRYDPSLVLGSGSQRCYRDVEAMLTRW
jgi:hypothetical protein